MEFPCEDARALSECGAEARRDLFAQVFVRHRERLKRMVALRLDGRLQRRVDASDVVQEAYLEASRRLDEFLRDLSVPLFVWLRFLTAQALQALHRRHLGAQARDARREVYLYRGAIPEATSEALAAQLLGQGTSPSDAAVLAERRVRLQEALNRMNPLDREVLALRHFELLSGPETAQALGIGEAAARQRYVRAIRKLKEILASMPGDMG